MKNLGSINDPKDIATKGFVTDAISSHTHQAELPAVTSSDNGKILCVVGGAWAAASIPSAAGASF